MNFWNWALFYIYSGIALGGLCAGKASELCSGIAAPDVPGADEQYEKARQMTLERVVVVAQNIGSAMANGTTLSIAGTYNSQLAAIFDQEQTKKQVLQVVPPANSQGA